MVSGRCCARAEYGAIEQNQIEIPTDHAQKKSLSKDASPA
jgi:hypothetical protein